MKTIGVDIGGTFTDVVMVDDEGRMRVSKVPSTPENLALGVLNGIKGLDTDLRQIDLILHGTTVATNAMLEKKGAKTGLITTKGFRDILEIRRGFRLPPLYDLLKELPEPLVPRNLRLEVDEKMDYEGNIITPIDIDDVEEAVKRFKSEGVEAIAVCLLFSYVNREHEQKVKEIIKRVFPDCFISLSSEILPMHREYERTSVTVINAYLSPKVSGYIRLLTDELKAHGYQHDLLLMRASGGVMSEEVAINRPVYLIASGPVAGVIAALNISKEVGYNNIISLDTGGTSCDVGVIIGSEPSLTKDKIYTYQLAIPMVDVSSIGTGGGSIAWIDEGGALQVGPKSAGAYPGPACYNIGGADPTLTDAYVILGYINPDNFLGGAIKLNQKLSYKVIEKLAKPLNTTVINTALGIFRIANASMTEEIRLRIAERGYDPREFTLVAFGGAGPIHAGQLAMDLSIGRVIVPMHPGLVSAMGCLLSDLKYDFAQSFIKPTREVANDPTINLKFNELLNSMELQGVERLKKEGIANEDISVTRWADMRYTFQTHEIKIPLPLGHIGNREIEAIEKAFHNEHEKVYLFQNPNDPIEFVELYVAAIGKIKKPQATLLPEGDKNPPEGAITGKREVFFAAYNKFSFTLIYDRTKLLSGNLIEGSAIIEEMDSTTLILPDQRGRIDSKGNIIIEI